MQIIITDRARARASQAPRGTIQASQGMGCPAGRPSKNPLMASGSWGTSHWGKWG